ncbi:putative reverse transcriptase domain-containing protein, partial [Tanacetum coccineum]
MALGTLGQRSPIRLLFTYPHIVDLGDILPLEGLLLVTMVVSGCIIIIPFVVRLPFRVGAEFLIHQVVGQLNSLIQLLGSGRLDVPINVVRKSTDVLVNLL